jgi:hypothetical protein
MKLKALLVMAMLAVMAPMLHAEGSVTQSIAVNRDRSMAFVTLTVTGDATNGRVPATTLSDEICGQIYGHFLYMIVTDPGSPAPTDNYDITITNAIGLDVLGGAGENRDTANTERARPKVGSTDTSIPIDGALTLNVTNNSVASAKIVIKLYITRER